MHGYMSSNADGRRRWGHKNHMGVTHSCYKTREATKECRKLNNQGGIMVVMETSFASSTAVFTRCWQLGTHMLRQSREQNLLAASYKSM